MIRGWKRNDEYVLFGNIRDLIKQKAFDSDGNEEDYTSRHPKQARFTHDYTFPH